MGTLRSGRAASVMLQAYPFPVSLRPGRRILRHLGRTARSTMPADLGDRSERELDENAEHRPNNGRGSRPIVGAR